MGLYRGYCNRGLYKGFVGDTTCALPASPVGGGVALV